ncbi:MAG: hypothetical protein ACAI43_10715 [Phycisphaerae bacterium]
MIMQRFNCFQQIMRLWDRVHPYNAAQVMHVRGPADVARLRAAWTDALTTLGVGRAYVTADGFRHGPPGGRGDEIPTLVDDGRSVSDYVSEQLNLPMEHVPGGPDPARDGFCPLRPFVITAGDTHYAGVIYHHWAADSSSVRLVLREWFTRAFDPAAARTAPVKFPEGGFWHYFKPGRAGWRMGESLGAFARSLTGFGNVRRLETPSEDYRVACTYHPLPDGTIHGLKAYARRQGVSINDLFLAATAEACDRHGILPTRRGREEIALGTVADIRGACRGQDLSDVFGLFLGFTTNVLRPDALRDWPRLVRKVASQTSAQKACNAAAASQIRMAAALLEAKLLPLRAWVRAYLKHVPLAAAISNVNLGRTWAGQYHPDVLLEYMRFTPAGPSMPMVFTPSSIGGRLHLALTRRTALVDEATARRVADAFCRRISASAAEGAALPSDSPPGHGTNATAGVPAGPITNAATAPRPRRAVG